jgi:hypothetical protein
MAERGGEDATYNLHLGRWGVEQRLIVESS